MKKYLLLLVVACGLIFSATDSMAKKSILVDDPGTPFGPDRSSFPQPFNPLDDVGRDQFPVSTGYYFVDSYDVVGPPWTPEQVYTVDTSFQQNLWYRILPGPNIRPEQYWLDHPEQGRRYFRNPGDMDDSTDNAFAGPIPIGFEFYFNGIRYDSFYVSTNGLITLTNRRYIYDDNGDRAIPLGADHCYDIMSMDWFAEDHGFATRTAERNNRINAIGDNGLLDPTADDFGYQVSQGALLNPGYGNLSQMPSGAAVIAPFYGNLHMSQWDPTSGLPRDFGRAYYKRTMAGDSLIIYFVNAALFGNQTIYIGYFTNGNAAEDGDPSDVGSVAAQAQVILVRTDSSVAIHYERFDGGLWTGSGRVCRSREVYRYNTVAGVRGYARHTDFDTHTGMQTTPWAGEYEQYTHYFAKYRSPGSNVDFPGNKSTVKFKQWKNTLRVVGIKYMIRKRTVGYNDFDSLITANNVLDYEFLAGHDQLGPLQPVAIIQNLTNDRQGPNGVNFHNQDLNFRARFFITNQATRKTIYNKIVNIDSACIHADDEIEAINCANNKYVRVNHVNIDNPNTLATSLKEDPWPGANVWNGIPPYNFVEIFFPPFVPQEYFTNHIGRMTAVIAADPTDPRYNEPLGDMWPFDDSTNTRFFVMRRWNTRDYGDFRDDVSEYHVINGTPMPSVMKWVSIGATVVDGDETTHTPLPPLGPQEAANGYIYGGYTVNSPVIFMDRFYGSVDHTLITGNQYDGDEIRSYPIDLTGRKGAVLSLSVARFTKRDDWARGWCDEALIGPEHRCMINNTWYDTYSSSVAASYRPDEIDVEFAFPSANSNTMLPHDKMNNITNLPSATWRTLLTLDDDGDVESFKPGHPYGGGNMGGMAAYAIYGGGGYLRGYTEGTEPEQYNNALGYPKLSAPPALNGLVPNVYDDGVDYEFNKVIIPIPDPYFDYAGEGAFNFRFRIKVYASNDKKCQTCIDDDPDPFYVDNIRIITPQDENVDVEVSSVKVKWPYTLTPASQATKLPIKVKISNNTSVHSPDAWVKVRIYNVDVQGDLAPHEYAEIDPVYCGTITVPALPATELRVVNMPEWNARLQPPGRYKVIANVYIPAVKFDLEPKNDTTYSYFELRYGGVFAYDPIQDENNLKAGRNDVDQFLLGTPGRGLNLYGFNNGGTPRTTGNVTYNTEFWAGGYVGGNGSGSIAMKFELVQKDTLYGFQALYGPLSQAREQIISFSIYNGSASSGLPSSMVPGTEVYRYRAYDDIEEDYFFDSYVTHLLDEKIVLDKGIYWVVISQLEESGLELGATASRMGMRVMSLGIPPMATDVTFGRGGTQLIIDKNLRTDAADGSNSLNNNIFAYSNTKSLGNWVGFMVTAENPAYAHLHHTGVVDGTTRTLSRGTWLPLIRPYLKERSYGEEIATVPCGEIPVELTEFVGDARDASIDLFWTTASETTNEGFYVERRTVSENAQTDWVTLGFVKGNGTTEFESRYSFSDPDVVPGYTYEYRLHQVDIDGELGCTNYIGQVEVTFVGEGIAINGVYPNPVLNDTEIKYFLAENATVSFEVVDLFGNVVATWNENGNVGVNISEWDATGNNSTKLVSGRYILRATYSGFTSSTPLTIVR